MFADNAGAYPSEASFRLERLSRDKRFSLLQKFVNYRRKKFYNIDPRLFGKYLTKVEAFI
jgi:hypothetical protein